MIQDARSNEIKNSSVKRPTKSAIDYYYLYLTYLLKLFNYLFNINFLHLNGL
jgi:hypothetical protein